MSTFDRSQFKATKAANLKQADKELESIVKQKESTTADYINIPEKDKNGKKLSGSYKIRIYPYHPDGGGNTFAESKVVHWLPVETEEKDKDGNIIMDAKTKQPKIRKYNKPYFNSRVHGTYSRDVVEEYINFANKIAAETYPKDAQEQKKFLAPINGGYGTDFGGILATSSWAMYVDQIFDDGSKIFGRLEIGKAVKQRLNAIASNESANEPLGTDPFTDIVDGRAVIITYNANAEKAQDFYTTELDTSFDKVSKKVNLYPLSDEDLEKFLKYPSLHSQFRNVYKRKDFDNVIKSLKLFDDTHNIGVFQYDEFLDICEEISNHYPVDIEEVKREEMRDGKDIEKMFSGNGKKEVLSKKELSKSRDSFDDMDREELKDYCRSEKTGIIITNKMSDDDVRDKLREWFNVTQIQGITKSEKKVVVEDDSTNDLPWDKDGNDVKKATLEKEEIKEDKKTFASTSSKIEELRKRLNKS